MSEDHEKEESFEEMEFTRKKAVHAVVSFALMSLVMVLLIGVVFVLKMLAPDAETVLPDPLVPAVNVLEVQEQDRALEIVTQGVVESLQDVMISAEVGGRVVRVSANLLKGASVSEGELLVEIEKADYQSALKRAEASREEARLLLAQEEARREQAIRDWEKLGRGEPSDLVLRKPHIESAKALLNSAIEEVNRAGRDLDRTEIRAPFSGVVSQEAVEPGAILPPGSMVARVYSMENLEIRLPVSLEDFGALARDDDGAVVADVTLTGVIGLEEFSWPGEVVRTDGRIDSATLSATVIVRIDEAKDNPAYLRRPPVGMFLEATIPGMVLENVLEIPRETLREGNKVLVVNETSELNEKGEMVEKSEMREIRVNVLRSMRKTVLVRDELKNGGQVPDGDRLKDGDEVILTRMSGVVGDARVNVMESYGSISEWEKAKNNEDAGKDNEKEEKRAEEGVKP